MPQSYAASVQGVSLRVTRLDANGNLLNGPTDSYLTTAFIRVSFTPEYEDGDEITEKNAAGEVCVSYKAPDTLKRVGMEIAICDPDPELSNLMSGGLLLSGAKSSTDASEITKGWASAQVGEDPSGNGVAVETWSRAIQNGKPAADSPFWHWVFPFVKTRLTGDRVVENGLMATSFEGYGLGNIMFRNGPDGSWAWPAATDRPYLYGRTNSAPQGMNGFFKYPSVLGVSADSPVAPTPGPPSFDNVGSDLPGTNVPNAGPPYSYRADSATTPMDPILSSKDYTPDATGAVAYEADADSQTVKNVPPASALQNPVTYAARGYPAVAAGLDAGGARGGIPFTFSYPGSFSVTAGTAKAPQDLNEIRGLGALGLTGPMTQGQYVTLGDGSNAYFNGSTWLAGVTPTPPTSVSYTTHAFTGNTMGTMVPGNPADLAALNKLGALGSAAGALRDIGTLPEYVDLADGTHARWNGTSWVALTDNEVSLDVSLIAAARPAAAMANLAALQADGAVGDGNFSGGAFATGQYIVLRDGSKASYDGSDWQQGAAA